MRPLVFIFMFSWLMQQGKQTVAQPLASSITGSGIYLTESDFLKDKISLFADDDASNHLERSLDDVILTRSGKKYKLGRGSFFGYVQSGQRFRFYQDNSRFLSQNGYFRILEESSVVIYSKVVSSPKTGSHIWYYYSDELNSPIKKLSSKSLKNVSPEAYSTLLKYTMLNSSKAFLKG